MITSDDLSLICTLAQEKSIAAVARAANISPSAISQRLTALEGKLGIRIAERFGRSGIVMTAEGEFLETRGKDILRTMRVLNDDLAERKDLIGGKLRIVAPFGFGRHHIAPLVSRFAAQHPELQVDLRLSEDLRRLPKGAWDIMIRVGPWRDTSLVVTQLAANKRVLCASPQYIAENGTLNHPDEIQNHKCIVIFEDAEDVGLWTFRARNGRERDIRVAPHLATNDGDVALCWAKDGRGILLRSAWSAAADLKSGDLVELLHEWSAPEAPIVAMTGEAQGRSKRIHAMLQFLGANLDL